jgi:hypothetical protein
MKKLIAVLLLSIGLVANVNAAETANEAKQQNKVIKTIKNHPKKTVAMAAVILAGTAAGTIYLTRNTDFVAPRLAKAQELAQTAWNKTKNGAQTAWNTTKDGAQYSVDTVKAHPYISGSTAATIATATALIADYKIRGENSLIGQLLKKIQKEEIATA